MSNYASWPHKFQLAWIDHRNDQDLLEGDPDRWISVTRDALVVINGPNGGLSEIRKLSRKKGFWEINVWSDLEFVGFSNPQPDPQERTSYMTSA
jgi:hypothetical protein